MSVILDRPPEGSARRRPVRSVWIAWSALALTPVLVYVALWLAFGVFGEDNINWAGALAVLVLMTVAPATALVIGVRAALVGSRSGRTAATIAAVLLVLIVSVVARWAVVIVAVVALGVAIYWYRHQHGRSA